MLLKEIAKTDQYYKLIVTEPDGYKSTFHSGSGAPLGKLELVKKWKKDQEQKHPENKYEIVPY